MIKILSGVFVVQKRWNNIHLQNKLTNNSEIIEYFKFNNLLFQSFTEDQIKKILDALNAEKKLLIDFDKDIVKVIVERDESFMKAFSSEFSPSKAMAGIEAEEPLYL